jgi:hypothetical protein
MSDPRNETTRLGPDIGPVMRRFEGREGKRVEGSLRSLHGPEPETISIRANCEEELERAPARRPPTHPACGGARLPTFKDKIPQDDIQDRGTGASAREPSRQGIARSLADLQHLVLDFRAEGDEQTRLGSDGERKPRAGAPRVDAREGELPSDQAAGSRPAEKDDDADASAAYVRIAAAGRAIGVQPVPAAGFVPEELDRFQAGEATAKVGGEPGDEADQGPFDAIAGSGRNVDDVDEPFARDLPAAATDADLSRTGFRGAHHPPETRALGRGEEPPADEEPEPCESFGFEERQGAHDRKTAIEPRCSLPRRRGICWFDRSFSLRVPPLHLLLARPPQ